MSFISWVTLVCNRIFLKTNHAYIALGENRLIKYYFLFYRGYLVLISAQPWPEIEEFSLTFKALDLNVLFASHWFRMIGKRNRIMIRKANNLKAYFFGRLQYTAVYCSWCDLINEIPDGKLTQLSIECFHMTTRQPYWCPKTMKRQPCWCPKPILWELNSFLMQTLSFVATNLHRCWPREWKHSIDPRDECKVLSFNSSGLYFLTDTDL